MINWAIDKIGEFTDYQTINKLRLLVTHMVRGFIQIPNITMFDLKFNLMLEQIIRVEPVNYKLILGLLVVIYYKNLECQNVKREIMNSIILARKFKTS